MLLQRGVSELRWAPTGDCRVLHTALRGPASTEPTSVVLGRLICCGFSASETLRGLFVQA